jgi:hypothetical protein
MSRLAGLRQGYENADAMQRMISNQRAELAREGRGLSNETREGRGEILRHMQAERSLDHMASTIRDAVGGWNTTQELKDAAWLLERASRWQR